MNKYIIYTRTRARIYACAYMRERKSDLFLVSFNFFSYLCIRKDF